MTVGKKLKKKESSDNKVIQIIGGARTTQSIPYLEALNFLISSEKQHRHPPVVSDELRAIISHWLQSPHEDPLVLGREAGERWRETLAEHAIRRTSPNADPKKASLRIFPRIDFGELPFPPLQTKPQFTFIDLFAGIGGFRIALQERGGKCVFSSEWEPHAKATYEQNFGETPFGDILNFTSQDDEAPIFQNSIPEHEILAAGFPCQAFSQAGKQLGFNEARGTLFFEILKIAKARRPRVMVLENVKRLKTHDHGRTFDVITKSLHELGYKVYAKILRAYDYGLPQNRERIFIVAFDEAIHFEFPPQPNARRYNCVGDILEPEVDDWYTISDRIYAGHKRRLREHRERGNGFGFSIIEPTAAYTNTISARYWKDGSEILIDQGSKNPRMLTPRECARLQGFDDRFLPHESRRYAYQQFGNSVPVVVVKALVDSILISLAARKKAVFLKESNEPVIF